ncbi:uncharacterized protein SPPG_02623 [Spizellomyces punctatus DAOM BR117]|uniref:RGS domain-containing protein n=1 Tax=Spizellomyces punctatus (strain DAOM BR117) TaxID=645134 RepID=A0A0L0HMV6_SPIPD|nr:uncharacterized protein SPPG_02623 [Spizellomyces punctatus DAOM BR117]KND02129.1 hypothetical protein SPPG_02623 [Spizellomyces punctatus DAOM BR117]|eukprot:XP_016610168.1 hypothetical protein SPPG_02623 [Spizellomyces punctatus DAOM BR117]
MAATVLPLKICTLPTDRTQRRFSLQQDSPRSARETPTSPRSSRNSMSSLSSATTVVQIDQPEMEILDEQDVPSPTTLDARRSSLPGKFGSIVGAETLHRRYRQKTTARFGKLSKFFGSEPPLDISVSEVEQQGLKALLMSKVPRAYFLYSLLEDYSCENLFFFLEVEHYTTSVFPTVEQQRSAAQHIYNTYLNLNSHFEVNLDERVRKEVVVAMSSDETLPDCFDSAKRAALHLMEGSWQKFARSDIFARMKKEIGTLQCNLTESRQPAVLLLMSYLDRQAGPLLSSSNPAANQANLYRHLLIRHMIHEYCRTILQVDFDDPVFVKLAAHIVTERKSVSLSRTADDSGDRKRTRASSFSVWRGMTSKLKK